MTTRAISNTYTINALGIFNLPLAIDSLVNFTFSIIADADASYSLSTAIGSDGTLILDSSYSGLSGNMQDIARNVGLFAIDVANLGTTTGVITLEIKYL